MKKRIVSIELLRIVSMMMVVMLHYLGKSELLAPVTESMDVNGYVAWGMETLSIVAVNVYMLISGYFLVESGFKPHRAVELVCQVLFYTILVPVVLMALGIIQLSDWEINRILENFLPIQMEQYWFISAYMIMYLMSPILSTAAKTLSKEQLRNTIIGLLLFFSVSKSILPVQLALDQEGYDGIWFMCVFLVAAYMRLYGLPFFTKEGNGKRGWLCYLLGCAGIYAIMLVVRAVYLKTGSLDHFIKASYDYNHILNLLAAIGLFYAFVYLKIKDEGIFAKLIYKVAPYTLGVYLLHEQLDIRYLWQPWLGATPECGTIIMVLKAIGSILLVFVVGVLVDMLRSMLFGLVKKMLQRKKAA